MSSAASVLFKLASTTSALQSDAAPSAASVAAQLQGMSLSSSASSSAPLGASRVFVLASTLPAQMPRYINLTDSKALGPYLKEDLRNEDSLSIATQVAGSIYETSHRKIGTSKSGVSGLEFPMNPEILAYAMKLAPGEIVLEVAGASGQNSILLAFTGAQRVYMNELDSFETERFKNLRIQMPSSVSDRLEAIEGSCFDILKKQPELAGKIGLFVCRNLMHFFNDEQQSEFMVLVKTLLKPGGRAIFTVNSVYTIPEDIEVIKAHPEVTTFSLTQCISYDRSCNPTEVNSFYQSASANLNPSSSANYLSFTEAYLLERSPFKHDGKWIQDPECLKLPGDMRSEIMKAVNARKSCFASIKSGAVKALITPCLRLYNIATLPALFQKHGLEIEFNFALDGRGHLVSHGNLFDRGSENRISQIGVIIQKPQALQD